MTLILTLLGYAAVTAAAAPALLGPLTRRGTGARACLAAWLAAGASVLGAAGLALALAVQALAADWPQLTRTLCQSVAGDGCTPAVYRGALYQGAVAVLAAGLSAAALAAAWRYGRRVRQARARTRGHARAALLVGRALPGVLPVPGARTVVLDDQRPAAYCVAGHPAAIVVTSGALAVLQPPQLRAVLAHETAHLAGGHHALATVVRGLAATFPGVPLFSRVVAEVGRLAEMAADDRAVQVAGRPAVASALIALALAGPASGAPGRAVPAAAGRGGAATPGAGRVATGLGAAAHAVPARVDRLLAPPRPARAAALAALLVVLSALLVSGPALLAALAG